MGRLNEKQQLIALIAGAAVLTLIFAILIWVDYQAVNAHSDMEDEAALAADPAEWGEMRKMIQYKIDLEKAEIEAAKIKEREDQVIVYREVVERDAAVLPDQEDVNEFAQTIREFENVSGVAITSVSDLTTKPGQGIQTLPINLQLSGTFDQFLKFINLFESYDRIVNTRSFTIGAGAPFGEWPEIFAEHKIALAMETYVYNRAAQGDQVPISNYEQRKNSPDILKQIRQLKAAQVGSFTLRPRVNRRDPLISPRRRPPENTTAEDGIDLAQQKADIEEVAKRVRTLDGKIKAYRKMMDDKNYVQAVQMKDTVNEDFPKLKADVEAKDPDITDPALRERWNDTVLQEFDRVATDWDDKQIGDRQEVITRRIALDHIEPMRKEWDLEEYENVLRAYRAFEQRSVGKEVATDAKPVVADMESLKTQAQNHLDFRKLGLTSTGVIRHSDPTRSRAIIDKRTRKIGDFVDEERRCRLVEITQEGLLFDFRGERIWLRR